MCNHMENLLHWLMLELLIINLSLIKNYLSHRNFHTEEASLFLKYASCLKWPALYSGHQWIFVNTRNLVYWTSFWLISYKSLFSVISLWLQEQHFKQRLQELPVGLGKKILIFKGVSLHQRVWQNLLVAVPLGEGGSHFKSTPLFKDFSKLLNYLAHSNLKILFIPFEVSWKLSSLNLC